MAVLPKAREPYYDKTEFLKKGISYFANISNIFSGLLPSFVGESSFFLRNSEEHDSRIIFVTLYEKFEIY